MPTFFAIGGKNVAVLDIIVLVILIIFLIVGASKGFMRQLLGFLGVFGALVLTVLLCDKVAKLVTENIPQFYETVKGWATSLFKLDGLEGLTGEELKNAIASSGIPSFLQGVVLKMIESEGSDVTIVVVLANWMMNIMCGAILFVVILIVFAIVKKILTAFVDLPIIKSIDKLLGAVFAVLKGLLILLIVCMLLSLFIDINKFLSPTTEAGEPVQCLFNEILTWFMNLPFVSGTLASIFNK